MTTVESLTLIIALLAIIPALVALVRQSKQRSRMDLLEDAQLRQNRATAALHEKQLELLVSAPNSKAAAQIKLELIQDGRNYRFRVSNIGNAPARSVKIKVLPGADGHDPSADGDYNAKFPAPIMEPGSSISYIAAIYLNSPSAYNAIVSWQDMDGTSVVRETYVAI